jgi:hypothetical protein
MTHLYKDVKFRIFVPSLFCHRTFGTRLYIGKLVFPLSEWSLCEGEFRVASRRHLFSFPVPGSSHIFTPCSRWAIRSLFQVFLIPYHKAHESPRIFVYSFSPLICDLSLDCLIFAKDKTALGFHLSLLCVKLRYMKRQILRFWTYVSYVQKKHGNERCYSLKLLSCVL